MYVVRNIQVKMANATLDIDSLNFLFFFFFFFCFFHSKGDNLRREEIQIQLEVI